MATSANVIALSEMSKSAGLITWWRLHGEIDLDILQRAWRAAGLDETQLPTAPSPTVALRRALATLYERPNVQLQKIPATKGNTGGFAVVHVSQQDVGEKLLDPEYTVRRKVWLEDNVPQVRSSNKFSDHREDEASAKRAIWAAFQQEQQKVDAHDLSVWLVKQVDLTGAVRLREGGGVYFVPETTVKQWRTVTQVFESISKSKIYEIPAMRSDRAVAAILDAITSEAEAEAERINAELTEVSLGKRAITTRQSTLSAMLAKVSNYEKLLGTKLEGLHGVLSSLEARLVEASLVAE